MTEEHPDLVRPGRALVRVAVGPDGSGLGRGPTRAAGVLPVVCFDGLARTPTPGPPTGSTTPRLGSGHRGADGRHPLVHRARLRDCQAGGGAGRVRGAPRHRLGPAHDPGPTGRTVGGHAPGGSPGQKAHERHGGFQALP